MPGSALRRDAPDEAAPPASEESPAQDRVKGKDPEANAEASPYRVQERPVPSRQKQAAGRLGLSVDRWLLRFKLRVAPGPLQPPCPRFPGQCEERQRLHLDGWFDALRNSGRACQE